MVFEFEIRKFTAECGCSYNINQLLGLSGL